MAGHEDVGDARAGFEEFVEAHGDRLLHAAFGLCGDWQHAEDLVQQVLVTVARRWSRITDNPSGYAYRCLGRASIDRWRVLRRQHEVLTDPTELADRSGWVEAVGPVVHEHLAVLAALQGLPARQRAIVVLRYLQDLSESDTAAAMGISVGAVKSGASRALARLRAALPDEVQEVP